jgi:hypothetical protein
MERRDFLKRVAVTFGVSAVPAPVVALIIETEGDIEIPDERVEDVMGLIYDISPVARPIFDEA